MIFLISISGCGETRYVIIIDHDWHNNNATVCMNLHCRMIHLVWGLIVGTGADMVSLLAHTTVASEGPGLQGPKESVTPVELIDDKRQPFFCMFDSKG